MKTSIDPAGTLSGPAMGTRWTARLSARASTPALHRCLAATVERVESQMSLWREDSDLSRLNRAPLGEWQTLPPEILLVLATALRIGQESDGLFDIAVGNLVRAWGFGPARGLADPAAIRAHLGKPLAGRDALELDTARSRARRLADVGFDLSAIAKGYAVDLMAETLERNGVGSFLVGLDGEIRAAGQRPDGRPWAVALESPDRCRRQARGLLELTGGAVATSGDYRHFLRLDDGFVSHSMNPRIGGPVQNRLASVTVFGQFCMEADAWATVLMVLGETAGPSFAAARRMDAIFLVRSGTGIEEVIVRDVEIPPPDPGAPREAQGRKDHSSADRRAIGSGMLRR